MQPPDSLSRAVELDAVLQPLRDICNVLREQRSPPAELLTRETFAALLNIGTSTFDRLRETGKIGPRPVKLAGLKWPRSECLAWLRHRAPNGELHDSESWPAVWEAIRKRAEK
jgi:predicted DNA-binding transcriptional regulator AlpA